MSDPFFSCPGCNLLLLADAPLCPRCGQVIDAEAAESLQSNADDRVFQHENKITCRECEVDNGFGLVRCWNCGSFLREDIERMYREQIQRRSAIDYQPLPELNEDGSTVRTDHDQSAATITIDPDAGAAESPEFGDFELSAEYVDDFFAQTPEPETFPEPEEPAVYSLATDGQTAGASTSANEAADEQTANSAESEKTKQTESEANNVADEAKTGRKRSAVVEANDETAHSEATGGDVLLQIALQEEKELSRQQGIRKRQLQARRKQAAAKKKSAGRVLGRVSGEVAGQAKAKQAVRKKAANQQAASKKAATHAGQSKRKTIFGPWCEDVRLHEFEVSKIKLKPGAVESQSREVDVACSDETLVVTQLTAPSRRFGRSSGDNKADVRKAVRQYWESQQSGGEYPGHEKLTFSAEAVKQMTVVQPCPYEHESPFKGVAVFGAGRIVVSLTEPKDGKPQQFLSFTLSGFRVFSQGLARRHQVKDFGTLAGVPLQDSVQKLKCHYSDEEFETLDPEGLPLYEADPKSSLTTAGYRCQSCKLVVSEESRRKEKIGGLNGKSLGRAKCPKCGGKFGNQPLFALERPASADSPVESD